MFFPLHLTLISIRVGVMGGGEVKQSWAASGWVHGNSYSGTNSVMYILLVTSRYLGYGLHVQWSSQVALKKSWLSILMIILLRLFLVSVKCMKWEPLTEDIYFIGTALFTMQMQGPACPLHQTKICHNLNLRTYEKAYQLLSHLSIII